MTDHYPSRGGNPARLAPRIDPTVYCSPSALAPVLTPDQVEQYAADGFVLLPDVFSADEVACFVEELERLRSDPALVESDEAITEPGGTSIRSIFRVHAISPVFRKMCADVRLAGLAQGLLNDHIYVHQSRLNYKPGFRGKEFYWHSDFETWHVEDGMPQMRALSMSITLTENTPDNGPLMLMPGSHTSYAVCSGDTPPEHFRQSLKKQEYGVPNDEQLAALAQPRGIVSAVGKPGSVIVFDCNVMHGSNSNITPLPRSNVFFVYNAITNRVVEPFCDQPPRPEYICSRQEIEIISPRSYGPRDYRQADT